MVADSQAYSVQGMHCPACVERITDALQRVPGVTSARVTLSPPRAEIAAAAPIPTETLAAAVARAGDYSLNELRESESEVAQESAPEKQPSIYPLLLILLYIAGTVALATYIRDGASLHGFLSDFMAGFFLVFSFFKLLDLRGFADAYRSYDIPARLWKPWSYAYPFVELALGVAFLIRWQPAITNAVTLILMLVGASGVFLALSRKTVIRCACLGTVLNLPMTTVTLTEDLGMAAMAAVMLLWRS